MVKWQAVIFDMDDTLYPERDYVMSGFRAVAEWGEQYLDIPAAAGFGELAGLFEAGVRGDTFNRWLVGHGFFADDLIPQLIAIYRDHTPLISSFPGVENLLAQLHFKVRLGLISDGFLAVQQRKFEALGLSEYFDAVVFSDEWGRDNWKPSPKPFLAAAEKLRIEPSAAVYIADNPAKDFFGARQVGMATIWMQQPGGEYAHLTPPTPQHAPDFSTDGLLELRQLLGLLGESA